MTDHMQIQALVASGLAFVFVAALAVGEAIQNAVDVEPQDVAGWVFGLLGTGGLFWKVWSDRSATTRADGAMDSRIADMRSQLDALTADRDFWRDRAIGDD